MIRILTYNLSFRAKNEDTGAEPLSDFRFEKDMWNEGESFPSGNVMAEGESLRIFRYVTSPKGIEWGEAARILLRDVHIMKEIAGKYDVAFVVMTYPNIFYFNKALMDDAGKSGVNLIDNMTYFYSSNDEKSLEKYFCDEPAPVKWSHPNEKGYKMMVDNIIAKLPAYYKPLEKCR